MRRNWLYWVMIFSMFLVGGAGIFVFIISLFTSHPARIKNTPETDSQFQGPESYFQPTKQFVGRNGQKNNDMPLGKSTNQRNQLEEISQTEYATVGSDTPENQSEEEEEEEIRTLIVELESELESYNSEIQLLGKLRHEYWDRAQEYAGIQADESYRKIRELEAPLREGVELSREEIMAIEDAVKQVIKEVNSEIKRLVELGNQASAQQEELFTQRNAIREDLASWKSLIGEE